jgi:hypothetical protein
VLYHPRGELLARIIGNVILEKPAQKIAAHGNREADGECELVAKRSGDMSQGGISGSLNLSTIPWVTSLS